MQQIRAVGAMSIHQLIASVKAHKEEAKLYRDEEAYEEAIEALKEAVAWIDESDWERRSDIEVADQKTVAWHLADCLGMMGGNARRLGRLEEALKYFKRGGIYEIDRRFEINSSYNLVNAIVIPIENRIKSASEQKEALAQAVSVLQDQVFGKRRMDRWAWADLGQCLLLLGDRRGAKDAYLRFMELGDEESVKSAKNVLNKLHKPLKDVDEEIADAIVEGISQLEKGT
jgi:tetratricopeptide (TPR) repeat protein